MAKPKVNLMTQVVMDVQKRYPELLNSVVSQIGGGIGYMKQREDPRAVDKRLLQMQPDQMAELARTNPVAAEHAAKRISDLEAKAPPPLPGAGEFEGQA